MKPGGRLHAALCWLGVVLVVAFPPPASWALAALTAALVFSFPARGGV